MQANSQEVNKTVSGSLSAETEGEFRGQKKNASSEVKSALNCHKDVKTLKNKSLL